MPGKACPSPQVKASPGITEKTQQDPDEASDARSSHAGVASCLSSMAPGMAAVSCLLFCLNSELLQALQRNAGQDGVGGISPLLNLTMCHLGGLPFALWFLRSPPTSFASIPVNRVHQQALLFAFLLMGYNYAWLRSAQFLPISLTNAILQLSVAIVYVASTLLFGEPRTPVRVVGVVLAIVGSLFASSGSLEIHAAGGLRSMLLLGAGLALAFAAAVGYAGYQVLFKYLYGHLKQDARFLMYFGASVSVCHVFVILPLVVLADWVGFEVLVIPKGGVAVAGAVTSAIIASTVNAMYLFIVMWGSPMLLPCTSALSVPLTVALDAGLHGVQPKQKEIVGHMLVGISVALIMGLHHGFITWFPEMWDKKKSSEGSEAI
eukprot:gnl/TRDRNA2_/TRDRNA2_157937_c0_seq1.p1 gnl/TRDRNA2_/TRDRNA2_157937_c0~~gnl/TRDRNA2_/TRDRNA2_157937_c0_seq1.p1  ORF type:complete len:377 (+),score=56.70 gnl/TRDRNA2_/TRDRNA2_157937_c0_seq1:82-1212(+)